MRSLKQSLMIFDTMSGEKEETLGRGKKRRKKDRKQRKKENSVPNNLLTHALVNRHGQILLRQPPLLASNARFMGELAADQLGDALVWMLGEGREGLIGVYTTNWTKFGSNIR